MLVVLDLKVSQLLGAGYKLGDQELNEILEVVSSVAQWMSILGTDLTVSL